MCTQRVTSDTEGNFVIDFRVQPGGLRECRGWFTAAFLMLCMCYWLGVYGAGVAIAFCARDLQASWQVPPSLRVASQEITQGMLFEWAVCLCTRRTGVHLTQRYWIYRDEVPALQWVALRKILRGVVSPD